MNETNKYVPASNTGRPIEIGNPESTLMVMRSHPDFPNTLSPELEGLWFSANPAWPEATVDLVLAQSLNPPCHTVWQEFDAELREDRDGEKAYVVYVRPGLSPQK